MFMSAEPRTIHDLAALLKVIADETRLRILGLLASEPQTGKALAESLELSPPTISHHMRKLVDAGVVIATSDAQRQWYRLNSELLLASRKIPLEPTSGVAASPGMDEDERFRVKVIRDFFVDGRLKEIPAQRKRRVVVLQRIVETFDPSQSYSEREINDLLRPFHPDFATLRRELIDYGFMTRDRNIYQVTRGAPQRSKQVLQEITGDEQAWFRALLGRAIDISTPEQ
jgi:biotin operon repressor